MIANAEKTEAAASEVALRRYWVQAKFKGICFGFYWSATDHGSAGRGAFIKAVDIMRDIHKGLFPVKEMEVMRALELEIAEIET